MSGLEALGGIAAVTQIFAYLLQALFEVRDQIKNAPARVQAYAQRLDSLRRTVQYIQDHPIFVTNVVEALLKTISEQVDRIRNILHKSFSREPRSLARRLIRLHVERMAEQQIRESLANLESYKSDLMICISSTMERSTTGMLLEDGGISLEAHAVTRDLSVTRKIVPVPKHGDSSQCQALIASGQRSDEFISTLSIEDEETTNSTSSVESDETLNSNPFTQRGEPGNSNRVDNSARSEWKDPNFANNVVDDNGFGIMGNYGNVARQQSSKFSNNSMRKNKVALMGNMDYQALSMLLNAKGALEALKVQVDN